jgi:hypothetical protein
MLFSAFAIGAAVRIFGMAGINIVAKKLWGLFLVYGLTITGSLICIAMLVLNIQPASFALPKIGMPSLFRRRSVAKPGAAAPAA